MLLLDAYAAVFECGLADDSLILVIELYNHFQQKNRLVDILEDERIFQTFHRLLRRLIPVYALLHDPLHAAELSADIYRRDFPLVYEDPASALYLQAYETILSGQAHARMTIF